MKTVKIILLSVLGAVLLWGMAFAQGGKVVVSNKPFTESHILAEIMVQLLRRHTDLTVERLIIEGGTTSILHPAIVRGDIDIYPEYTGTSWQEVLRKDEVVSDPLELYERVKKEYEERFGLVYLPLFGFNNTFTLAVRRESAEKDNLKNFFRFSPGFGALRVWSRAGLF